MLDVCRTPIVSDGQKLKKGETVSLPPCSALGFSMVSRWRPKRGTYGLIRVTTSQRQYTFGVAEDEGPELSTEVENSSAARAHKIGIVPRSPSAKLLLSVHSVKLKRVLHACDFMQDASWGMQNTVCLIASMRWCCFAWRRSTLYG
jgi:hypothetical protein